MKSIAMRTRSLGLGCLLVLVLASCGRTDSQTRPEYRRDATAEATMAASPYDVDLGFRPDRDGFSFPNYGEDLGGAGLSEAEVRELLGDSAVCARDTEGAECEVRREVVEWARDNEEVAQAGHCEGIAALSLAMFVGLEDPAVYGSATPAEIPLEHNDELQRRIAGWHATQFTEPTRSAARMMKPNAVIAELRDSFVSLDEVYTLSLFNAIEGSFVDGHTIVPYAIEEIDPSSSHIRVYDSNLPGEERFIEVDTAADTWSYQGAVTTYDGSADLQVLSLSARLQGPRRPVAIGSGKGEILHASCVPE